MTKRKSKNFLAIGAKKLPSEVTFSRSQTGFFPSPFWQEYFTKYPEHGGNAELNALRDEDQRQAEIAFDAQKGIER